MSVMKKSAAPLLSTDKMLGVAGSGLAVASIGFGLYMNTHGPAPGALGSGHDFSVFAQLAPRTQMAQRAARNRAATPATTQDALDTTATASIPKAAASAPPADGTAPDVAETSIIPSVTLEAASADRATIAIDGRMRTVQIGDDVPGAGEVLEIETGPRPVVKTSRGLIVAARPD